MSHLRVFGSSECIMVGYCETSKAYRLWNPTARRIAISRDVVFQEETFPREPVTTPGEYGSVLWHSARVNSFYKLEEQRIDCRKSMKSYFHYQTGAMN